MKHRITIIVTFVLLSVTNALAANNVDSLYRELDTAIKNKAKYNAQCEGRIAVLKRGLLNVKGDFEASYAFNNQIAEAYKAYRYDSTAHYLSENIRIAQLKNDADKLDMARLKLAYLFASSGMYLEAVNLIDAVHPRAGNKTLMIEYYKTCYHTYGEQGHYSRDAASHDYYSTLADQYKQKLLDSLPTQSMLRLNILESEAKYNKNYKEALRYNTMQMNAIDKNSPDYSIICFFRSEIYKNMNDIEMEKYWLALSAICDVKHAVRDQASLWTLADILASEGDIERSYRYIRFSWDGTHDYNTPLRNLQSSGVLSVVDHNYQIMMENTNSRLRNYLLLISALSVLLIIAIGYVYVQMKHLSEARNKLDLANTHLNELNDKLQETVSSLHKSNVQLKESNIIKEAYIGRFFSLCSLYMNKLDDFRKTIGKKAKAGELSEYLTSGKMQSLKDEDLSSLLHNFDSAFLCIVPNFIEEFNKLLKSDERIVPAKDELLTTELRIFALIRLGIEDSSKIAELLHYSVNTIYNYRAKVKNVAVVSREDFEKRVKAIA